MNIRNEIKAQIIRAGMTMQEVVDLLSDESDGATAFPTCPQKLQRESIRYKEVWACRCVATTSYGRNQAGEGIKCNSGLLHFEKVPFLNPPLSANLKERTKIYGKK